MSNAVLYGIGGIAVLALVIVQQLRQRQLSPRRMVTVPLLFAVVGLVSDNGIGRELSRPTGLGLFVAGLLIAAVIGALRGGTIRVWQDGDVTRTQGDWRTVALWVATIAVRAGLAVLGTAVGVHEGVGVAFLFVAVTFAAQNVYVLRRVNRLSPNTAPGAEKIRQ